MELNLEISENQMDSSVQFLINYILASLTGGSYTVCQLFRNETYRVNIPTITINWDILDTPFDESIIPAIEQGCSVFLMDQTEVFNFFDIFTEVHDAAKTRNPNKMLILTGIEDEISLADILLHPVALDIRNVFAIVSTNESVCLLTIESKKWKVLFEWMINEPFPIASSQILSSKKAYLNSHTVKLATFELIPFIQLIPTITGRSVFNNITYFADGLDGRIVEGFCEVYNCSLELSIKQDSQYGKLYDNRTADGMIGSLLNREVDVAIGGVAAWYHLLPYFSFTSPMQPISVTCLTPQPRLLPGWTLAIRIYQPYVWIMLLVMSVVIIVATHLIYKFNNVPHNLYNITFKMFGGILLEPTNFRVRSASETILSYTIVNFLFYITNMYLAKATSMRTFPKFGASIGTVDQLAASAIPWNAPHEAWRYSMLSSEKPSIRTLLQTFRALDVPNLEKKANQGEENFAIAFLAYGHYMVGPWITPENVALYRMMREDLYWEYELVWTTKTWPMYDALNEYVMRLVEANLQRYEELIVAQRYLNNRVQSGIAHSRDRVQVHRVVSKFADVKGYFKLLCAGQLMAGFAFGAELFWKKKNTGKTTKTCFFK